MEGLKGNGIMARMAAQPDTKPDAKKAYATYANLLTELGRSVVDIGYRRGDLVFYTTQERYPKIVELCKKAGIELPEQEPSDIVEVLNSEETKRKAKEFWEGFEKATGVKVTK